jgi:transposase
MVDDDEGVFDQRDSLIERLRQRPGVEAQQEVAASASAPAPPRWTLRTIRASVPWLLDYTLSGVWRVLQRCRVRLRSAQLRMYSPDPDYSSKEATLLRCLRDVAHHPTKHALVFLDEMGYYRWPAPATDWGPAAPDPAPCGQPAGTNTQWRIVGALNALTGQVNYLDDYIVGRKQLITFYGQLNQRYADVDQIYVVQDNWSIHRHDDVLAALQQLPRLVPIWLPTYAPWLNPIEKVWRWLRQDVLKLHRLADDWKALRQQVRDFLNQFQSGSQCLLHYVGLLGEGKLAQALNRP